MLLLNIVEAVNLDQRKQIIDQFFDKIEGLSKDIQGNQLYAKLSQDQKAKENKFTGQTESPLKVSAKRSQKLKRQDTGMLCPAVSGFDAQQKENSPGKFTRPCLEIPVNENLKPFDSKSPQKASP